MRHWESDDQPRSQGTPGYRRSHRVPVRALGRPALAEVILLAILFGLAMQMRCPAAPSGTASTDPASYPLLGRSVEVDPAFSYYQHRSSQSIAAEVAAHGYRAVHYEVTADRAVREDLITAFHAKGMGVWYTTFLGGAYSTDDLPPDWHRWRMVTRSDLGGRPVRDGFERLCLNNPDYRAWKKREIVATLRRFPFDGIDLKEPHWPDYPGPESPTYGCFCAFCRGAFLRQHPECSAVPDIIHPASPAAPQNDPILWRKWVAFRAASLTEFLSDLVNGPGGIREACPKVQVASWTLALLGDDGARHVREDNGEDLLSILKSVRPDFICLQTHWPDWSRPDLPPEYVEGYAAFLGVVKDSGLARPLLVEADTGSLPQDRRSSAWINRFERSCAGAGISSTVLYEYSLGLTFYKDPPAVLSVRTRRGSLELQFSKRLDGEVASQRSHYMLSTGSVVSARVDGATVQLEITGLRPGQDYRLTLRALRDTPATRLYHDHPFAVLAHQTFFLLNP